MLDVFDENQKIRGVRIKLPLPVYVLFSSVLFCSERRLRKCDGGDQGEKVFLVFTVHSVHLWFFINNFMVIHGEHPVKSEQWIVHLAVIVRKKKTGSCRSEVGYVAAGSSHLGSQSPLLSSLSVRLVCVPSLVCRFS